MPSRPLRALLAALLLTALAAVALPAAAQAQATRTWVSGVGDDANPCSRIAPCKTFAGAISKTAENGEIDALDPGGFGGVTITKSITIAGTGTLGSILNQGITGVLVNAGPTDRVILRDLTINGGGSSPFTTCPQQNAGAFGVRILKAANVTLENVDIQQQGSAGVSFEPTAPAAPTDPVPELFLNGTTITSSCGPGVAVKPVAPGTARVTVRDTTIEGTTGGIRVDPGGTTWLTGSTIFDNTFGIQPNGGIIKSYGDNRIHDNTDGTLDDTGKPKNTDGKASEFVSEPGTSSPEPTTVTVTQPAPPPTTVTETKTVTAPPTTVPPTTVYCTSPRVIGLTKSAATTRITRAGCALGAVRTKAAGRAKRGRVVSQTPSAGTQKSKGAKVGLTLGR